MESTLTAHPDRRTAVRHLAAGVAGAIALPMVAPDGWALPNLPEPELASRPADPKAALERLAAGQRRFVEGRIESPRRNVARMRELVTGQAPFAAFLGCADSRVPIEIVFDQGFGDLFITRVAGNIVTPEVIGSLEFAVAQLGVQVIYVLGHTFCGAVAAAAGGGEAPGEISVLYHHIVPAIERSGGSLPEAVRHNARWQARLLRRGSPVIAKAIDAGRVALVAGVYDLVSGAVSPVELDG